MGRFVPLVTLHRVVLVAACFAIVSSLAGCAKVVQVRVYPGLENAQSGVTSVAVAPFSSRPRSGASGETAETAAAPVVARQVAEAISARGVNVIPPEDVARALENAGISAKDLKPEQVAEVVSQKFGANTVLMGQVARFRDRRGENLGASSPASVGFDVTLHQAPSATKLWGATFDETQKPMSSNLFNLGRYPGGGTRWLTAEELSSWGAEGVAEAFPVSK